MTVWVFQATVIVCTALVPVYFGTFKKSRPKQVAGLVSAAAGLILSLVYYLCVMTLGYWDSNWEVQVWKLPAMPWIDVPGIKAVYLWTECGIIITPIVLVIFLIANALGKKVYQAPGEEAAA